MIPNETEKQMIKVLKTQNDILYNDIAVMRTIIKSILELKPIKIDNIDYFKVEDIIYTCKKGFKSLSNEIQKENENNGKNNNKRKN